MSRILITGTSKGIGYDATLLLARRGHDVIATMRSPSASDLEKVASEEGLRVRVLPMDVDDDASVRRSLRRLLLSLDYTPQEFATVDSLLEFLDHPLPAALGCVIADVTLPGRRGTESSCRRPQRPRLGRPAALL